MIHKQQVADCQAFVHRIRERAHAHSDAAIASLRKELHEVQMMLDEEAFQTASTYNKLRTLRVTSKAQEKRIEELESEVEGLRDLQEQMRKILLK